jgi:hypothetical protein
VNRETPPDYRRVKVAALQQLAAGGDSAAARELERRGVTFDAAVDVKRLDYPALRSLVLAWNEGTMPADREQSRARAEEAQRELEIRYAVDVKLWRPNERYPTPPPAPPWTWPRHRRCEDWQRPTGSTLYPSEQARQAAQLAARTTGHNRGRRAAESD